MTKILLVEDDKSLREIYGVRLLAEGYDIVSAGDGEQALAMAIKERPQLIVSDVMMPKISGFDMLDILRSTTETKDIKVIMMTALSSEDQRARGEALGADRYLVKSQVGIEDVVRTIHEVLGDAPVSGAAPAAFGSQAPSAAPRPATPTVPPREPAPSAPAQPVMPQPAPASPPNIPPRAPVPPSNAHAAPVMPQPTAPFSTSRPASLGERVIHPITPQDGGKQDIGSLMDQELSQAAPVPSPVAPAAPLPPPPAPPTPLSDPQTSVPEPAQVSSTTPEPSVIPSAPLTPPMPPQPPEDSSSIEFEETPRPNGPIGSGRPQSAA